jgi:hypothetical protein
VSRDTSIANRLRAAGIRVVECAGWTTRGSTDFNPRGSVNHHTAGPASGATPSLNTCINGRPDLAGPLCNVMQSREPDGRDIAYVVAAGRANHAGEGGWKGLSGNSSVYGLEVEHTGTSALPQGRIDISAAIHAAMFGGDVGMVCQHYEWTSRKIDAATNVDGNDFRNRVAAGGGGDDFMAALSEAQQEEMYRAVTNTDTWVNVLHFAYDMEGQMTTWKGNFPGRIDVIYDTKLPEIVAKLDALAAKVDALAEKVE